MREQKNWKVCQGYLSLSNWSHQQFLAFLVIFVVAEITAGVVAYANLADFQERVHFNFLWTVQRHYGQDVVNTTILDLVQETVSSHSTSSIQRIGKFKKLSLFLNSGNAAEAPDTPAGPTPLTEGARRAESSSLRARLTSSPNPAAWTPTPRLARGSTSRASEATISRTT